MQPLNTDQRTAKESELIVYGGKRVPPWEKQQRVQRHFDAIASRYDLAYLLMSFGLYRRWRRKCVDKLHLKPGEALLDLCGGTGDLAGIAARAPSVLAVVCDLNWPMMDRGRKRRPHIKRTHWVQANAEALGFSERVFDAVFVGLGLRNLAHVERGLREMLRTLKDGGRLVILEFSIPPSPIMNTLYRWYSQAIMPNFGRLVTGARTPFEYLAESVRLFPLPHLVSDMLDEAGFVDIEFTPLSRGLVTLYSAKRPIRPHSTPDTS